MGENTAASSVTLAWLRELAELPDGLALSSQATRMGSFARALCQAYDLALGYERWEADMIEESRCWGPEGMAATPTLTQELLD
ncbi:MAG: hypothetical protein ACREF4_06210, partial [Gammaproteobacteria bacterium]